MNRAVCITLLCLGFSLPGFAKTITVDLNAGGDYTQIQLAIDAASDGDTVLVKPGDYVISEAIDFNRQHDSEDPTTPPVKNIVVRSERGAEETIIRMTEEPADWQGSVVIFQSRESEESILEGFTLTGGKGTWVPDTRLGGGVFTRGDSNPTLIDCAITGNPGGGVYCAGSPTFRNCTISGNSGEGVYCAGSPTFRNCAITGNSGRGVHCGWWDSSPMLIDCAITGNAGGGIFGVDASAILKNCAITGNSGAGVSFSGDWLEEGLILMTNCKISGNSGRGVYCSDFSPTLTNCTISGNSGGGVYCSDSLPTLTNCIVWGNAGEALTVSPDSVPNVSYSCLETQEVWSGEGNIKSDPLFCGFAGPQDVFVDARNPDPGDGSAGDPFRELSEALEYRVSLQADSPCIGTGRESENMGADEGTCEQGVASGRLVHLASGRYSLVGMTLAHGASLVGEGAEETVLEGTVYGLRTGARLSRVTVTGGTDSGIVVSRGEDPTIEDCTISENWGGVLCREGGSPTLRDCTVSGNWWRGGVSCWDSSPTLQNCTISGNFGSGLSCWDSSPTLQNCTISGNSGSGLYCSDSEPTLINCTISGNALVGLGGVNCSNGSPILTNCTISGNSGSGLYCLDSEPTLINCTISGNFRYLFRAWEGYGVFCRDSSPILTNCIVWGNESGAIGIEGTSTPSVTYSCIDQSPGGDDNIKTDPQFTSNGVYHRKTLTVDILGREYLLPDFVIAPGDYRLQPGSPCIDAGTSEGAPATDIDGNGRPCGGGVDMGAYEFCDLSPFVRGDVTGDLAVNLEDVVDSIEVLFPGFVLTRGDTPARACPDAADANDDGVHDLTDVVYLARFLFDGGGAPQAPFPECGPDETDDGLWCFSSPCE